MADWRRWDSAQDHVTLPRCRSAHEAVPEVEVEICRHPERSQLTPEAPISIVHYMVNYRERQLDRTFATLVDGTRRAILARLEREDSASVSELAKPFAIKLPAVMKHLDVLHDAGLITRSKVGRIVTVRLRPEPMREAMDWLRRYERFWSKSLYRLAAFAESKEAEARKKGR
jgi:DNA-binding transcriptional ArsR family regulator